MRHKPKFVCLFFFCCFISNFFLASFAFLFFPFLFSLSSTLYPLSIHWKSFGLSPSKNLEMEHWSARWLGLFYHQFCTQIGHVFSGIALPEFGRYSKWTHVWMDLSLLCQLLIKTIWWRQKWWRHKWLNDFRLLRSENTTADRKELSNRPQVLSHYYCLRLLLNLFEILVTLSLP